MIIITTTDIMTVSQSCPPTDHGAGLNGIVHRRRASSHVACVTVLTNAGRGWATHVAPTQARQGTGRCPSLRKKPASDCWHRAFSRRPHFRISRHGKQGQAKGYTCVIAHFSARQGPPLACTNGMDAGARQMRRRAWGESSTDPAVDRRWATTGLGPGRDVYRSKHDELELPWPRCRVSQAHTQERRGRPLCAPWRMN